jgi:hypothetical protein
MAGIRDIVRRGFVGSIAAIVTKGYGSIQGTAPTVTTTTLPGAGQNVAYTTTLAATGDVTITWDITVGALPTGLSLDGATGIISGTPTTVESQNFTVRATNSSGNDTQALTLAVAAVSSGGGLARSGTSPTGRGMLRLSRG